MAPLALLWGEPPERLELGLREIHVWVADLDAKEHDASSLAGTLSDDERERAARFRFERDQRHYAVRRGLLRAILGRYLGVGAEQVGFQYGPKGKPALAPGASDPGLRFNLSDCTSLAVYAVTRGFEVGIDVEQIRALPDADAIAERFFSAAEREVLRRLPPENRPDAFFTCWTRKESYIKAIGDGLSCPLESFDVTLAPGAPPALLRIGDDPQASRRWSMWHLEPAKGYSGALACEAVDLPIHQWRWTPPASR